MSFTCTDVLNGLFLIADKIEHIDPTPIITTYVVGSKDDSIKDSSFTFQVNSTEVMRQTFENTFDEELSPKYKEMLCAGWYLIDGRFLLEGRSSLISTPKWSPLLRKYDFSTVHLWLPHVSGFVNPPRILRNKILVPRSNGFSSDYQWYNMGYTGWQILFSRFCIYLRNAVIKYYKLSDPLFLEERNYEPR